MDNNLALKVVGLTKSFGNKKILDNINLEIKKGESFVLIGQSGTGKSVLIKNIIGILEPDSGKVYINGIDVTSFSKNRRLKINKIHKIGMLFQGSALFDSINIEGNVTFGVAVHSNLSKHASHKLAVENLERVGLDKSILKLYPSELSGGMQKRVALARLIATKPSIMFFDEPTSGLDPVMSNVINNLIIENTKYLGATSFTITHDMHSAKKIGNQIAMIDKGKIIWQGTPSEIKNTDNPLVSSFVKGNI